MNESRRCFHCGREVWPHSWPGAVLWHDKTGKAYCKLSRKTKQHYVMVDDWPDDVR